MSVVLAFDTATAATVVGLSTAAGIVGERRDRPAPGTRPNHAEQLLALSAELLAEAQLRWRDVTRIGVGVGPGTFTGLRIGVATGRALAQASGTALVAVSTLEALALAARSAVPGASVVAVLDARRGEAFVASWSSEGTQAGPVQAVAPAALGTLVAAHAGPVVAVGDGAVRFRAALETAGAVVAPDGDPSHEVHGKALCELARAGELIAAADLLPQYVRLPDAEIARRERLGEPA